MFKRNWLVAIIYEDGEYIDAKMIYIEKSTKKRAVRAAIDIISNAKTSALDIPFENILQVEPIKSNFEKKLKQSVPNLS